MKTRIQVNELGEFYVLIPDDIVEELVLTEGEVVEWEEQDGAVLLTFG